MSNVRFYSADVAFALNVESTDGDRLTGPDREHAIRKKLQAVLENGTVRDALSEVGLDLAFATVGRCKETRG